MAEKPISLSKHRKAKARAAKRAQADANAVKFGRTKAEDAHSRAEEDLAAKRLDQHRRDDT
ncbi:MAG: DUF4169 family protein [Pseudomonadota bacterium]